jgi:predicted RNA methylase
MTTYVISDAAPPLLPVGIYYTKGLDDVVTAELQEVVPEARIVSDDERFIIAEMSPSEVVRLASSSRTIDDLRLMVAGPVKITDERDFAKLCDIAAKTTSQMLGPDRNSIEPWSVTLSSRNPVWRRNPKWQPDEIIRGHLHDADLNATARSLVDLRLQVDRQEAHVSLSVTKQPVGKQDSIVGADRLGALRRTVAASLVRMAVKDVDQAVLDRGVYDPFCGTGTIVAEVARYELPIFASDIDPEAVTATRQRLAEVAKVQTAPVDDLAADLVHRVFQHDVLRGVPARVNAQVIVGNLPWGKQVKVERRRELFDAVALIVAPTLEKGGACALLTTHEDQLMASLKRHIKGVRVTARHIGLLGQTPAIVVARKA